jgi:predicted DNA-binding protein
MFCVRLPLSKRRRLKLIATRTDKTIQELMEELIDRCLEETESPNTPPRKPRSK